MTRKFKKFDSLVLIQNCIQYTATPQKRQCSMMLQMIFWFWNASPLLPTKWNGLYLKLIERKKCPLLFFLYFISFFHPRAKNGTNVSDVADLKGRFTTDEDSIRIRKPLVSDNGNYTCSIKQLNLEAYILAIGVLIWITGFPSIWHNCLCYFYYHSKCPRERSAGESDC